MKLLLTSGGVTNPSIRTALESMLPRPIDQCRALCIPAAQWGHPACGPDSARRFVAGDTTRDLTGQGWASVGLLELTALPSISPDRWGQWVQEADVLLVDGGEATYLAHWLRRSGLIELFTALPETVWVGVSAGSMALTPRIGDQFVEWSAAPNDQTLGLVSFSIFPHLEYPGWAKNTKASAQRWAATIQGPAFAIDDHSAITVNDDMVDVVSEGQWIRFPGPTAVPTRGRR